MKSFEVNTHHGYLNTEIVIKCSSEACEVQNLTTGVTYNINSVLAIKLCAGKHILYCAKDDHKVEITIEDAIKLGGSQFKDGASFVSEKTPWIAITMKDRIYFYNRDTKSEFVEHNLSPASVKYIGGRENEYFLFETEGDYSVFNAQHRQVTYNCNGVEYSNNHLIISKEQGIVTVYDYINDVFILQYEGQYSICESNLFYISEVSICKLDLNNNEVTQLKSKPRSNVYQFGNGHILVYVANYGTRVDYELVDLMSDRCTTMYMNYFITSFCGTVLSITKEIDAAFENVTNNAYKDLVDINKEQLQKYHMSCSLSLSYYEILRIVVDGNNSSIEAKLTTKCKDYARISTSSKYLKFCYKNYNNIRDAIEIEAPKQEFVKKQQSFEINRDNGKLVCYSDCENIYISLKDNELYETNIKKNSCNIILNSTFDSKKYLNAYFNSDGNSVVAIQNGNTADILGFNDLENDRFDLTNSTVCYTNNYGVNGYKPELDITICDGRKPIWRDPMTLNIVSDEQRTNCIFRSPDGKVSADNDYTLIYYNSLTDSDITYKEYNELCRLYDWKRDDNKEQKEQKIALRDKLAAKHPDHKSLTNNTSDRYVDMFVKQLYYIYYRKGGDAIDSRVLIGENVWYVNYISFSYNSRYMAIAVRYLNGSGKGGECLMYDLEKEKLMFTTGDIETTQNIRAVWMAMFTRNDIMAFYSGNPCAYILDVNSENPQPIQIYDRSLLCFSRTGRYIAFSNQGYVAYNHGKNYNWGHQPSGNVYIHSMDNPTVELEHYCDLGEKINGVGYQDKSSRAGNVASAAFSTDEKRFLVVGDDGVVVVRNIKLLGSTSAENIDHDELPF